MSILLPYDKITPAFAPELNSNGPGPGKSMEHYNAERKRADFTFGIEEKGLRVTSLVRGATKPRVNFDIVSPK